MRLPVTVDLTGASMEHEDRDLFPSGTAVAHDGAGNFWVVDDGGVFFASHDPPFVAFVGARVDEFVEAARAGLVAPPELRAVVALARREALGGDAELSAFASALDDRFVLFDLRGAEAGDGFEWGRFGPHTELRRCGAVRLFACARTADAGARRRGLFRRS